MTDATAKVPRARDPEKLLKKGRKAVEKKANALSRLEIVYVPIDAIRSNEYNPNRQSEQEFELLIRSITEDGFTQPVLVQRQTNEIVDGYHRWSAARQMGFKEIPVVYVDMTPAQMRISTLRHNRARGSEELELTAQVLRDLRELGALDWAQDSLMMDDLEVQRLLDDVKAPEALAGDEFGESWEPARKGVVDPTADVVEGKDRQVGLSAAASTALREHEEKLKQAKTDEERAKLAKESGIYRVVLMFSGEESKVVRKWLGPRPAMTVLEAARAATSSAKDEEE